MSAYFRIILTFLLFIFIPIFITFLVLAIVKKKKVFIVLTCVTAGTAIWIALFWAYLIHVSGTLLQFHLDDLSSSVSTSSDIDLSDVRSVYWTDDKLDRKYHIYDDCPKLGNTVDMFVGPEAAAIENGKTKLCDTCKSRYIQEQND